MVAPADERVYGRLVTLDEDFDAAVGEIFGKTGESKGFCLFTCGETEVYALDNAGDF